MDLQIVTASISLLMSFINNALNFQNKMYYAIITQPFTKTKTNCSEIIWRHDKIAEIVKLLICIEF